MPKFKFKPNKREDKHSPTNAANAALGDQMVSVLPDLDCMDIGSAIADAIADLLHLADREGVDGHRLLTMAEIHWQSER